MSSFEELRAERIKKRDTLVSAGMDPYTAKALATHTLKSIKEKFDTLVDDETEVIVAGRVMSVRLHGGSAFADLYDGTDKLQVFFSRDAIGMRLFDLLNDTIDQGDFIEVKGIPFITKRGTEAIGASDWRILTKSLQAIPSEHFGIKDEDERFRKRYLDILLNPELREILEKKVKFWEVTRNFLKRHGFYEVETPTLEITTGGAEARPFKTHHNDFDINMYLRISVGELWQKRLMAAGYPKTFEIGRVYRNEGTSPEHLQEFTNMEFYWAYADYQKGMDLVKEMYKEIAQEVFGTTKFTTRGHTFDLANEWVLIDYVEEIKKQTSINILVASKTEMQAKLQELGVTYEGDNKERLTDTLWKYCRKQISGPAFLINHPVLVAPLAKKKPGTEVVEMFQPIIAGSEVGRGYSELNDPEEQAKRFSEQQKLIEGGDEEAMMPDYEFVEMLEYGMPPTCGFGFGERLFAFLIDKPLREVQLFPLMRPHRNEPHSDTP
jgi:lysyl-tRNA synthetase, class II